MRATITIYAVGLRYDGVVKQKEAIGGLVYAVAETWRLVWGDEKLLAHLIFLIFTFLNLVYDPFFKRKTTFSENNFLMTLFLLCSYFLGHPITLHLNILGGRMHGRP